MNQYITGKAIYESVRNEEIDKAVDLFNKTEEEVIKAPLSVFSILFTYISFLSFNTTFNLTSDLITLTIISLILSTVSIITILTAWLFRKKSIKTLKYCESYKEQHKTNRTPEQDNTIDYLHTAISKYDSIKNALILSAYSCFIISLILIMLITIFHLAIY
jgi:hypothetical protein